METLTLERSKTSDIAGTIWRIDPTRSKIGFSVKHLMFATVHGHFGRFTGAIRFDRDHPDDAAVEVEIDAASIDTGIKKRDDHLRSADFLNVAAFPTVSYRSRSTRVEPNDRYGRRRWLMVGDLSLGGVTRTVELAVEQPDQPRRQNDGVIQFAATTKINRKDFGMTFNLPIEGGGVVVGDEVKIVIAVQAYRISSEMD
jgi:polyisoprenoid-binding protein YceI